MSLIVKNLKDDIVDDNKLKRKQLILEYSKIIIRRNFRKFGKRVNGTIDKVYSIIWENSMGDPFVIIPTII